MLIAGNWKMNGLIAHLDELDRLVAGVGTPSATVLICPPSTLVAMAAERLGKSVRVGGQDCHAAASGAHTGDVSAEMLADLGASYVIVGHSERRADHGESDAVVKAKAEAVARAGLTAIVCVGETDEERSAGRAWDVVKAQLDGSVPAGDAIIAYEPVWAIGTGKTASLEDIADMHGRIHNWAAETGRTVQALYGGSVKPGNAEEILGVEGVDGALVGGASLKADDFLAIVRAAH